MTWSQLGDYSAASYVCFNSRSRSHFEQTCSWDREFLGVLIGTTDKTNWIFPRDPRFAEKAGRILDLYERVWNGHALQDDEFVLSADEKTSIQARRRRHSTYPAQPGSPMKVEHEYVRCGAWAYIAALDVHRAKLFGRCERRSGIASFDRLAEQSDEAISNYEIASP